jgi:hypothetical protein
MANCVIALLGGFFDHFGTFDGSDRTIYYSAACMRRVFEGADRDPRRFFPH